MTEHSRIARIAASRGASTRAKRSRKRPRHHYFAFLSYSHQDEELAAWLHGELEQFRVPAQMVGKITDHGVIPQRLTPIFRDQQELAAAKDLGEEIEQALAGSQFLIVLCSPEAAQSRWTNAEVDAFKRNHPDGCVLAAIAGGEPFASEIEGRETDECFPPALRQRYDRVGRPTGKRAEPLAADLREEHGGRRIGFLKLVAGMLGVGLDELVQRETTRRQRRLAFATAASIAGMALTSLLAVTAIQARDEARDQRREAEGLVAFMLGDLKDKLEPIGRLDALDGVGAKVLDYYRKQDASDLPDNALLQRAQALSLSAQVAYLRGDLAGSERLYREALEGTAEAVRRKSDDPQRLFDHAQNVFYFGTIAADRGDFEGAARAFQSYKSLAGRMVAIAPNDLKLRMEAQYADFNLGIILMKQRQFAQAEARFRSALQTINAIAGIEPGNRDYQQSVSHSLAWLADSEIAQGKIAEAIRHREQQIAHLSRLSARNEGDVSFREMLIPARIKLGRLFAASGNSARAQTELNQAVATAGLLIPREPGNRKWLEYEAIARLTLAMFWLDTGNGAAGGETDAACRIVDQLIARDPKIVDWQSDRRICLTLRARLALDQGDSATALREAQRALAVARTTKTVDPVADRYRASQSYRLLGDVYRRLGDGARALQAWQAAMAVLPGSSIERPWEAAERALLLERLGQQGEGRRIAASLRSKGIRYADILSV
ncbi:MAG: TIR domain-containing protein [Sphingomicrobium sp.]